MNQLKHILVLVFISLVAYSLWSCAQRGRPEGGPIDEDPPKVMSESPANYSTLFRRKEIKVTFDEYIKLSDPRNQIIFSPPISPRPDVHPMGPASKFVRLEFELDSLEENTTYTINFGTSIEDNNEGNQFPFYKYVFSTGDYLDSLTIGGYIDTPEKRITDEFVSVMLYSADTTYTDSIVFNKKPRYISYTIDSTNYFQLENLKEGAYMLRAISDKMNNYKFDPNQDMIGFWEDTIFLPEQNEALFNMSIFKEILRFKGERPKQEGLNRIIFGYRGHVTAENHEIKLLSEAPEGFKQQVVKEEDADTLNYWFTPFIETDSLLFSFSNGTKTDTLTVYPKQIEKDSLTLEAKPKGSIGYYENFKIYSPKVPIARFVKDSIQFFNKTDSIPVDYKVELDQFNNELVFDFEKVEETNYEIKVLPGAIFSLFEEANPDTLDFKLKPKKHSELSNLTITLQDMKSHPAIVQLINDKDEVKYEQYAEQRQVFEFELIQSGKYFIRVIYDENENRKWDTGDYLKGIQPEPVDYSRKPIDVRTNWDISEVITLPSR
ncbi:MAG: Ig-like domain-containing protein [Flavobacteriaceae bacterium]|nr:Ig-like domain-containing protein [Flavobacteriaceae bacterium]